MPAEIKMTTNERRKYLKIMRPRYLKADRAEKKTLLDEMEQVTRLHRKSLIRLMRSQLTRKPRQRQRGPTYDREVENALHIIAESMDYICAQRLTPCLASTAQLLAIHGELCLTEELLEKLRHISISTVKRILKHIRRDERCLPRRNTERALQLSRDIPAGRIPWHTLEPGHFEVDLVHHGGSVASGEYMCTLQLVDVATGWSERAAVLGRSALVMEAAFSYILSRLPFPILELHPDNGSEFLNAHLIKFFKDKVGGVHLSRSRPWKKDDNRFVEQKNYSLVRAYLGYRRFDTVAHVLAANHLYDRMWLYYNLFQPVLHISRKESRTAPGQRPRITRYYDEASSPFDRLCMTGAITPEQRLRLEQLRQQTNPRKLRQEIYSMIEALSSLPDENGPQDVRHTFAAFSHPARPAVPILASP